MACCIFWCFSSLSLCLWYLHGKSFNISQCNAITDTLLTSKWNGFILLGMVFLRFVFVGQDFRCRNSVDRYVLLVKRNQATNQTDAWESIRQMSAVFISVMSSTKKNPDQKMHAINHFKRTNTSNSAKTFQCNFVYFALCQHTITTSSWTSTHFQLKCNSLILFSKTISLQVEHLLGAIWYVFKKSWKRFGPKNK